MWKTHTGQNGEREEKRVRLFKELEGETKFEARATASHSSGATEATPDQKNKHNHSSVVSIS